MRLKFIILVLLALMITAGSVGAVSATGEEDSGLTISDFVATPKEGISPLVVTFTWDSTNAESYIINYGDTRSANIDDPNKKTDTYTYNTVGEYKAKITAINGTARKESSELTIKVSTQTAPPVPTISISPTTVITTSTPVTFTFSGATGATSYEIDFGDKGKTTVTTTTVKHTYLDDGKYTFKVKACKGELKSSEATKEITVSNTKISVVEITDITEPRTGETPDIAGAIKPSSNADIDGAISWSPIETNNKFVNDKEYTVTVKVKPKDGYEFSTATTGATTAKINGQTATIASGGTSTSLTITYKFAKTTPSISTVKLTLTAPATGKTPEKVIKSSTTGVDASKSTVTWDDDDDKFIAGEDYTATIIVPATTGYTYATSPKVYLNDKELASTEVSVTDNGKKLQIIHEFTNDISKVYLTIKEPSVGSKPATTATATDDLVKVNSVSWKPEDTIFASGSSYEVTINVKKLSLNYADTITYYINNKAAKATKKDDDSYDITYIFTTESEISKVVITLNAPVKGGSAPSTAHITSNPYNAVDGTVSWSPSVSTFEGDTAYTAKIKVNAFSGYKFASSVSATVNGDKATVTRTSDSSVTVSYTYPRTAKAYTDVPTIESTQTQTPEITSSEEDVLIPNPIDIIQELVKLFLSMFDFNNYVMAETPATAEQ